MIFFPHLSSQNDVVQNQRGNLAVNLSNQILTKEGPACKLIEHDQFLITLLKIRLGLLNEDINLMFLVHWFVKFLVYSWVRATVKVLSCMIKNSTFKPKSSNHKKYILLLVPLKFLFRHRKITYCNVWHGQIRSISLL